MLDNVKGRLNKVYGDGSLQGEAKTFFQDGAIERITHYDRGAKEGNATSYYENGQKFALNGETISFMAPYLPGTQMEPWKASEKCEIMSNKGFPWPGIPTKASC
jgi:hypothetical protein